MSMEPVELLAKRVFEASTDRTLVDWDVPPRQGAPDFRCLDAPTVALEVKRLTERTFHNALARIETVAGFHPSDKLARHWLVSLDAPTNGHPRPLVEVRGLLNRVEAALVGLEQRGVSCTRGAPVDVDPQTLRPTGPLVEFLVATQSAIGMSHQATPGMPPGITFHGGWGTVCRDDPDVLGEVVRDFLVGSSSEAQNLRNKLGQSTDEERHAFLIVTSAIDQAWLFDRWGSDRLPTTRFAMPEEIDVAWVYCRGAVVWRFDREDGWTAYRWEADPASQCG